MVMSEHHENIAEAERLDLLGDWEATRFVGKIRKNKDLKDPDESKRQLKPVSYEPWVPDRSGNPEIPLWLAARKMRLAQAYLCKDRKRARELVEMDIDPNTQVARLNCADLVDIDYHHH
eukprot:jgi/Tetstr1/443122/TSEL_031178.t1